METRSELLRYEETARRVRKSVLDMIHKTRSPHIGPSFSVVEILVALYFRHLNTSSGNDRDRFILSKGHACPALYAVLHEKGFISREELDGFAVNGGTLEQHPVRDPGRAIEASTGSLGHGLSIAAGMALAARVDRGEYRVYVLLSDGELNEGSVWEAVMFAGHHRLHNLIALVDYNRMQALGRTRDIIGLEPLGEKWEAFGWHVQEVDGHDFGALFDALDSLSGRKPNVLIMHTVKGKGVSFMENDVLWHYRSPDDNEYERALKELLT
ncbi:MAG: transketolase [Nitrospirae bacterium]|nr:transketolase [Nitrospirota bacterium]